MFWTEGIKRNWRGKEKYGLVDVISSRLVGETRVENSGTQWTAGIES